MATFTDARGLAWEIRVTAAACRRVRSTLGVDLAGVLNNSFAGLRELATNLPRLVDVLYILCQGECRCRGVSDVQFGEGVGLAVEAAFHALLDALMEFLPDSQMRALLRDYVGQIRAAGARG